MVKHRYVPDGRIQKKLLVGESNPGRLRDRQKCYQLHQRGSLAECISYLEGRDRSILFLSYLEKGKRHFLPIDERKKGITGIEPVTCGSAIQCSTAELNTLMDYRNNVHVCLLGSQATLTIRMFACL
jgi:hypothetical protein